MVSVTTSITATWRRAESQLHLVKKLTSDPVILVVEDDRNIRRFVCSVLKRVTKARVLEASDPDSALSIAHSIGRPIDLLISDIGLHAAKTGIELAREISAGEPSTKILLMSGGDFRENSFPAEWRFLAKPFPLLVFLDCVNDLLPDA